MVKITHAHCKTYALNAKLTRTSSSERASYGQASGTAGIVFGISATTERPILLNCNVTVVGTKTMTLRSGVFHGIGAGCAPVGQAAPSRRWVLSFPRLE